MKLILTHFLRSGKVKTRHGSIIITHTRATIKPSQLKTVQHEIPLYIHADSRSGNRENH